MKLTTTEVITTLYNLILNKATRTWEREQLMTTKKALEQENDLAVESAKLEAVLRPLAVRHNLTPDVADFYAQLTNQPQESFDLSRFYQVDQPYEERAIFAGGCFWCMVEPFETRPGIIMVVSGYTGGTVVDPTYDQVATQTTGHVEAVEIIFDNRVVNYADLVAIFWQITDPTDAGGQINDRGQQYRPVIFVQNQKQRQIAEDSKERLIASKRYQKPIVTTIEAATTFWPAENYHQQFYKKNRQRYQRIENARRQYLALQHLRSKFRLVWQRLGRHFKK
ncbi:peptide-methionine (S)-S-oxide reductase MsrA [Lapidilactobacillus dextrinicus]|uniref:peptide-methionine (S)-S-oxide reductase MsrA n=1 Tax=Lapidilactobacillus dextrinicus TaxID=51664 RepID=UPI000708E85B|nr:peptide-methionine (S)-S-oxide reductase MsrA [Lapidilactobacillus dextrinicus]QFG47574.1 peptide-methionine (S)-S-oxide reductase MsrA [Lapidilactobacillus dextrinicus]